MTETDFDRGAGAPERIETLLRDNHALTRLLDGERDENARLLAAVARAEGEAAALRAALGPVTAVADGLAALAARIDLLAGEVGRAAAPSHGVGGPAAAQGGRDEAAERLHAILTSRSWRLTRPIRGLGRLAKRFRG